MRSIPLYLIFDLLKFTFKFTILITLPLTLLQILSPTPTGTATAAECTYCHIPANEGLSNLMETVKSEKNRSQLEISNCTHCHINNRWAALQGKTPFWGFHKRFNLEHIKKGHLFQNVPPLIPQRYTDCGLDSFLKAPMSKKFPSSKSSESMFPLEDEARHQFLAEAKKSHFLSLSPCPPPNQITPESIARGEKLFRKLDCLQCHNEEKAAQNPSQIFPRLRLGIPLLSYDYFSARLRGSLPLFYNTPWESKGKTFIRREKAGLKFRMPAYPQLKEQDLRDLYQYISQDSSDLDRNLNRARPWEAERLHYPPVERLYGYIQENILNKSCRHCHSPTPFVQKITKKVFVKGQESAPDLLHFQFTSGPPAYRQELARVFSPEKNCGPAPIVQRLWSRHLEWKGEGGLEGRLPRGMPLLLPPIPKNDIKILERWTRLGCPIQFSKWCQGCSFPSKGKI